MNEPRAITPLFAVTGALQPADFAEIAAAGFKSVLSNLPDGESRVHPTSEEAAELAARAGLAYRHVPTTKADLFTDRVVDGVGEALRELPGPGAGALRLGAALGGRLGHRRGAPAAGRSCARDARGRRLQPGGRSRGTGSPARSAPAPAPFRQRWTREKGSDPLGRTPWHHGLCIRVVWSRDGVRPGGSDT